MACAPDGYVKAKMKGNGSPVLKQNIYQIGMAIKGVHRLALCNLIAASEPWIKPCPRTFSSAYECVQKQVDPNQKVLIGVHSSNEFRF